MVCDEHTGHVSRDAGITRGWVGCVSDLRRAIGYVHVDEVVARLDGAAELEDCGSGRGGGREGSVSA